MFYYFLYNKNTNDFYPTFDETIPSGYIQIKPIERCKQEEEVLEDGTLLQTLESRRN